MTFAIGGLVKVDGGLEKFIVNGLFFIKCVLPTPRKPAEVIVTLERLFSTACGKQGQAWPQQFAIDHCCLANQRAHEKLMPVDSSWSFVVVENTKYIWYEHVLLYHM
jgi:hypothetical protein